MAEQMVLTPGGFRPKSLANLVEPGHRLTLDNGVIAKIELATSKLTHFPAPPAVKVPFGAIRPGGATIAQHALSTAGPQPGALPNGWQTYAWWDSGGPSITSFSTTWIVPPAPSTSSGQTVFIFNGIQNTGTNFGILQPVLQWGVSAAGGGSYWAVANWYVTSGGQAFYSTLVQVNAGATLVGVMTQTSVASGLFTYNSTFQGIPNTTLSSPPIAALHWANETLECYGLNQCSDLPATAATAMTGINILIGTAHPSLVWTPVNAITNCGQHTVVPSNQNPGGEVDLFYNATGWHQGDLSATTGAPAAAGNPTGYVFAAQGTQHVIYRGSDNHIHELWWDNNGWHQGDLSAATGAPAAASDPDGYMFNAQGTQHVNYRGVDNHIHELWWDNNGWHHGDLTTATGAPAAAGDPDGYMFDAQQTQHVNYRGVDNHIHELWWGSGTWHHGDLTAATGAPAAASDPTGYVFAAQGTQHVIYRGSDNHIHELWWDNNGWHQGDLSAATGAPAAAGDPDGYIFNAQSTQHINYRGVDNHIHELWWGSGTWHHGDLTAITGAPLAVGNPDGYMFDAQQTQHVNYRGVDNHIHELWWGSGVWHHGDLSTITGAPTAASDPAGYMFDSQKTQHVVYRGADNHIHELWWN
jgi:hypothetical protein